MRRVVASGGMLLLAGGLPACLLFTDPINSPPQVMLVAPASVRPNQMVTFQAKASDPDGDRVTLEWVLVRKGCDKVTSADWSQTQPANDDTFSMEVTGHDPFCLRLVAQDRQGARTAAPIYEGKPVNTAPVATLTADPPVTGAPLPLYSTVRLTAGPLRDADDDAVAFDWKVTDATGADLGASLMKCDPDHPTEVRCLSADQPGTYQVTVVASDGLEAGKSAPKVLMLSVLEDAAPCIEVTDPTEQTGSVVMAVTDPPRRFEVRRVRDDGQPFPPGPHGGATFQWFTAREDSPFFQRALGFDTSVFDVSAARFADARPGSTYRVRVEVRDPQHESDAELHALDVVCGHADTCALPEKCVRWITWSVRFL